MTDRFMPDTIHTDDVSAHSVPTPPPAWGPGRLIRDDERAGWRFVRAIDDKPNVLDRWARPPVDARAPIATLSWFRDTGGAHCGPGLPPIPSTARIALVQPVKGGEFVFLIDVAHCDVRTWSETSPKDRAGTAKLDREQAEYLRDALTAMLARPVP